MARTRMEVDALTNRIYRIVTEKRQKKINSFKLKAKTIYDKEVASLVKKKEELDKQLSKIYKKYVGSTYPYEENGFVNAVATRLAKLPPLHMRDIEEEVILAGDQGADTIIKNVSEMYL